MASTNKKDYYEVLGVSKNATPEEIKSAYRKLAMRLHPDRCKDPDAKDKFAEVNEAYEVLSDKDKRARYDQFGFDGAQGFGGGPGTGFDPFSVFRSHFAGMDGFSSMFGGDDDGDDPMFGFSGQRRHEEKPNFDAPENGSDLEVNVNISFKEMLYGSTREFDFPGDEECGACHGRGIKEGTTPKTCSKCGGSGRIVHTQRNGFMMQQTISACPACHGQGVEAEVCSTCRGAKRVSKKKHVKVKIPQGIASGQRLRIKGEGECGLKGGQAGDLYMRIFVQEPEFISRDCDNLRMTLPLNPLVATLGGVTEVITPWKTEKIKIPAGTKTGKIFRLNGQGVKSSRGVGDLLVKVIIEPLKNLPEDQQKKLEEVKNALSAANVVGLDEQTTKLKQMFTP